MIIYAVLNPDKTPMGAYPDMKAAQEAIAEAEPDIVLQGLYQIHPLQHTKDAERLNLKVCVHWRLEKFEGEYAGQEPFEVLEGDF